MALEGRSDRAPYTKTKIWKILTSWHIWALTLRYIFFNNGTSGAAPVFAQFLKHSKHPKYTISQVNVYPTATYGVTIVTTLIYAWTSDSLFKGARWPPIVFGGVSMRNPCCICHRLTISKVVDIFCYVSFAFWDIPVDWKWACLILMGSGFGLSGLCFA